MMDSTLTIYGGGVLLSAVSWVLSGINPTLQAVMAILGVMALYWGVRKKKAEALRLERENEELKQQKNRRDGDHPKH